MKYIMLKALKIMLKMIKEVSLKTNLSNIVVRLKYSISFVNQNHMSYGEAKNHKMGNLHFNYSVYQWVFKSKHSPQHLSN